MLARCKASPAATKAGGSAVDISTCSAAAGEGADSEPLPPLLVSGGMNWKTVMMHQNRFRLLFVLGWQP
jgi:hypothetical protein